MIKASSSMMVLFLALSLTGSGCGGPPVDGNVPVGGVGGKADGSSLLDPSADYRIKMTHIALYDTYTGPYVCAGTMATGLMACTIRCGSKVGGVIPPYYELARLSKPWAPDWDGSTASASWDPARFTGAQLQEGLLFMVAHNGGWFDDKEIGSAFVQSTTSGPSWIIKFLKDGGATDVRRVDYEIVPFDTAQDVTESGQNASSTCG